MELEGKLTKILLSNMNSPGSKQVQKMVAQVKQAFTKEGWIRVLPADATDEEMNGYSHRKCNHSNGVCLMPTADIGSSR